MYYCFYFKAPLVTATSSCANLLVNQTESRGIIWSGYYSHYSPNMDCQWNISANTKLELVFLRFETYNSNDYVNVYDGQSSSSSLIGTFSGSSLPSPITSSGNNLFVEFRSDTSGQYEGFIARYRGKYTMLITEEY